MKSKWFWVLPALVLLLAGCVTVEKQYIKPTYDQSHAVLIEKTVADLALAGLVQSYVRPTEKVVVANIERTTNDDFFLTYMVDDHLIANLTQAGYKVLERDEDMIVRLMPEQSPTYKRKLLRTLPMDPALVLMDNIEKEGLDYVDPVQIDEWERVSAGEGKDINLRVDRVNLADVLTFYKDLKTDYRAIESEIKMSSADVIVAYRVLECGIVYDLDRKREKEIDPETGKPKVGGRELWTHHFGRDALARLFVRVTDAKTGEIRTAGILQADNSDTVTFQQGPEETETEYANRIVDYEELLGKYHYTFYDHQLPARPASQMAEQEQVVKGEDLTQTKKVNWLPWVLGGAGGLVVIGLIALAVSGF